MAVWAADSSLLAVSANVARPLGHRNYCGAAVAMDCRVPAAVAKFKYPVPCAWHTSAQGTHIKGPYTTPSTQWVRCRLSSTRP